MTRKRVYLLLFLSMMMAVLLVFPTSAHAKGAPLRVDLTNDSLRIYRSDNTGEAVYTMDGGLSEVPLSGEITVFQSDATGSTSNTITVRDGGIKADIKLESVRIENPQPDKQTGICRALSVEDGAELHLTYAGENILDGGIGVEKDCTLLLEGESAASVTAAGRAGYAGIGGNNGTMLSPQRTCHAGSITVKDGLIQTSGGSEAPGIGGGRGGSCTSVIIDGGSVRAEGGAFAPAVGAGFSLMDPVQTGCIAIRTGIHTLVSGSYAPSVGALLQYEPAPGSVGGGGEVTLGDDAEVTFISLGSQTAIGVLVYDNSGFAYPVNDYACDAIRLPTDREKLQWHIYKKAEEYTRDCKDYLISADETTRYKSEMSITDETEKNKYTEKILFDDLQTESEGTKEQGWKVSLTGLTDPNLTFRWQKGKSKEESDYWADVPGQTGNCYTVSFQKEDESLWLRCVLKNELGNEVITNATCLTVKPEENPAGKPTDIFPFRWKSITAEKREDSDLGAYRVTLTSENIGYPEDDPTIAVMAVYGDRGDMIDIIFKENGNEVSGSLLTYARGAYVKAFLIPADRDKPTQGSKTVIPLCEPIIFQLEANAK